MDHLIASFSRVIRNINPPSTIQALLLRAEADPSSLSPAEADILLDLPSPETVTTQLASISTPKPLSRTALLARDSASLTAEEAAILARRYWPEHTTSDERAARKRAGEAVMASGPAGLAEWDEAVVRLRRARMAVRPGEAGALEAAEGEVARRAREQRRAAREKQRERDSGALLERARPWVRRLWEEDLAGKTEGWGFAVFVQPVVEDEEWGGGGLEEYRSKRDAMLFHARGVICCGDEIGARWRLWELEWPSSDDEEEGNEEVVAAADHRRLESLFSRLRKRFKELRDEVTEYGSGGRLGNRVLQNTICVADRESIASVMAGSGNVDDMWVWALDPEYKEKTRDDDDQSETAGYKGYLKVRLQQLVNNFFEARRFQTNEYTMEALWEAAQASKHQLFVSVRPEEAGQWTVNRTVGSALRPVAP